MVRVAKIVSLVLILKGEQGIPSDKKAVNAKSGFVFESQIRVSQPLSGSLPRASSGEWKGGEKKAPQCASAPLAFTYLLFYR